MKLCRFGAPGQEKPGLIDAAGKIRDLSQHVADIDGKTLAPASIDKLKKLAPESLPMAPAGVRIGAPVGDVRNFIAVGLNYADHAKEAGMPIPKEPILFNKLANCIVGPNDDVMMPKGCGKLDWELEIAFVVNRKARYVSEADAPSYIAGYTICNDISARDWQIERSGGQWMKGKCMETSGPLGPWLVTPDELGDPQALDMFLDVTGKRMQTGNTKTMIFGCHYLMHYITQFMTLEAGDVVTTGTPPGVALGQKPTPTFLKVGDTMRLHIAKLGEQHSKVVEFKL